jgi:DNA modification methylase
MLGTGSTLLAAYETGRNGVGIELSPRYAMIAEQRMAAVKAQPTLGLDASGPTTHTIYTGDARDIESMVDRQYDYCITSPPYWDMLREEGAETQRGREQAGLDVYYSDDERDLGNIDDFDEFVDELVGVYRRVVCVLRPGAYMTVIVKNVKKGPRMYPLAWRLGIALSDFLVLKDERIWCQDNIPLFPYGLGASWVSNTVHNYCLNLQKPVEQ